ncbi:uncharacterized protein CMU_006870 [Cryptosporidium muris RN66]|uniref:Uncharacterized protein n=1 Tax=Cryptosporidium muris (strain RN66) TaxID=441375 RepID=B6AHR9_CRYMR|nr:uncharacterized protein CMU_006870 [Cryptosporidium muris RN66]EEA07764.1 hypothetical protein, conserved [Cryptosporidium muris RN66]|eukprot:XP_002142113.1 hypothetical protein [Cryptosporidium muris RN66]
MTQNDLFKLVEIYDKNILTDILEYKNNVELNIKDEDGRTILHNAVSKNNIELVRLLINKGVDVNTCDDSGWTPLHSSCSSGLEEITIYLLSGGAYCDITNNSGCTPLHYAASKGHENIVNILVNKCHDIIDYKDNYNRSAIFLSACSGKLNCFKLLLEKSADINGNEKYSNDTILHVAVNGLHEDIAYIIATKQPEIIFAKNNVCLN